MKLNSLPKQTITSKKRVGRGYGSGRGGHNSGRGTKGQKARGKIPAHFVGSSWVWFKRLPFIRGKAKFNSKSKVTTLTLSDLNKLKSGSKVTSDTLRQAGLITEKEAATSLKIIGTGKIEKKLTVEIACTASAISAITKAGGEYRVDNAK